MHVNHNMLSSRLAIISSKISFKYALGSSICFDHRHICNEYLPQNRADKNLLTHVFIVLDPRTSGYINFSNNTYNLISTHSCSFV